MGGSILSLLLSITYNLSAAIRTPDRRSHLAMRQRPQLLHHAVLRAAHRPDPVAGVVGPELHRHRPFQHRANALVHRLGRGPLRVPDRGRDLQNVAARHRPASCRGAGTRSRRKHTPSLPGQASGRAEGRPRRVRLRQSRPRDIDRAPLVGRRTAGLGGRSGDKAGPFEIVTVVRTCREMERARTILGNWAEAPAASGPSDPARREIACIEQAIRGMDDAVIEEHGGLQGLPRADRRAQGPAPIRAPRNDHPRLYWMGIEPASRRHTLTAGRRGPTPIRECPSDIGGGWTRERPSDGHVGACACRWLSCGCTTAAGAAMPIWNLRPWTGASRTWGLGLCPEPSGVPRLCSVMPGCQTAGRSANGLPAASKRRSNRLPA